MKNVNILYDPTAEQLRKLLGRPIGWDRPRTLLERKAYAGYGDSSEGGSGVLVGVHVRPAVWTYDGETEDFGEVPWVLVDYGMEFAMIPGTTFAYYSEPEPQWVEDQAKLAQEMAGENLGEVA